MPRPAGLSKTGGRTKGTRNRINAEVQKAVEAGGEAPLHYMLRIMRDPSQPDERRDEMARAAAPFVHPKLASTQISGNPDQPVQHRVIECVIVDPAETHTQQREPDRGYELRPN